MKEIKTTRTIEEVTGYEAFDGTRFGEREECKKYEESAEGVLKARVQQYKIGETTIYGLLDEGCDDCGVDIYSVPDADVAQALSQYISVVTREKPILLDEYVGKEIIIFWSYDHDYAWIRSIDGIIEGIRNNYQKAIDYITKEKEGKNV